MTDSRFARVSEVVQQEMARVVVPGVAVGVWFEGAETIQGFGVTSVENPLPVTEKTLYQIGSITKTYLGTLVMRLVEMGKVDLNVPIKTYLPDLQMQDAQAMNKATLFHCLTHTGGWLGDYFDDTGRGLDAVEQMVVKMGQLPQQTPLGTVWSYNNAGFYLAGRVIEVVTGKPFEQAMQEMIFDPLELRDSFFFAEDVISRAFVVGHEKVGDKAVVARPWALTRSAHPAGGIISNIPDLFRYARFHMGDGTLPNGERLLSHASMLDMQLPRFSSTDPMSVGLTWYMREVKGAKMFGHNGGTNGQITSLQISPEHKLVFAILTNSDQGTTLINSVAASILEQYLGVAPAGLERVEMDAAHLLTYAGVYDAPLDSVEVTVESGDMVLKVTDKGGFPTPTSPSSLTQPPPVRAAFYGEDKIFVLDDPFKDARGLFMRDEKGEIEWLRMSGRIHKKVG